MSDPPDEPKLSPEATQRFPPFEEVERRRFLARLKGSTSGSEQARVTAHQSEQSRIMGRYAGGPEAEFPADLIERCHAAWIKETWSMNGVVAVLRESGHAEIVAALQEVQSKFPISPALTKKVDAALRKASAL